jgi:hypothetical protein
MLLRPALSIATQRRLPPPNKISSKLVKDVLTIHASRKKGILNPQDYRADSQV